MASEKVPAPEGPHSHHEWAGLTALERADAQSKKDSFQIKKSQAEKQTYWCIRKVFRGMLSFVIRFQVGSMNSCNFDSGVFNTSETI